MEVYAPRAALYEVLPDFLLRLVDRGPTRERPLEPVWIRFSRGAGSYEAERSTVGAAYDFDRFEAEAGVTASFGGDVEAWFAAHYLTGSADVDAATGGGGIDATGVGPSLGVYWGREANYYARGGYSLTVYDLDLSSSVRGLLKAGAAGYGHTLDVEAGRRIAVGENVSLTPRAWAVGSRVAVDDFTDAVDARVSFPDADRLLSGGGVVAETAHAWDDGSFSLRGSVDIERTFSGTQTIAQVSGERLSLHAAKDSVLLGLRVAYRQGSLSLGADLWLRDVLASNSKEYSGVLSVGVRF
jgi:outer membrane autotransporter protein